MKPYDGGGWRGVSRVRNAEELHRAYNESGEMLTHLQAAVEGYDIFARALSIGAETMVMRFDPGQPMHDRYRVEHGFLEPDTGAEVVTISRVVNAFFRREFNSCEMLVKNGDVFPIDSLSLWKSVLLMKTSSANARRRGDGLSREQPTRADARA
jgi:hypothetical protein